MTFSWPVILSQMDVRSASKGCGQSCRRRDCFWIAAHSEVIQMVVYAVITVVRSIESMRGGSNNGQIGRACPASFLTRDAGIITAGYFLAA
jgi:hypothetical protein